MERQYFVDSWFFIARLDRFDAHHERARRLGPQLVRAALVTHDAVLTEVLTYFSGFGPGSRNNAVVGVREVLRQFDVVPASSLFPKALDFYESRPDKEYSLVDCMSMVVMRERGIKDVLTNDHHFRQEGFTVVSQ
ncbi:MAG TPA: PIN domain-containing protein [Thermoanaerobaculia bacterium]